MRILAAALALLTAAAPAAAQGPSSPQPRPIDPLAQIAQRIDDPATADQLARAMQSLAKAFLDLPVGERACMYSLTTSPCGFVHRTLNIAPAAVRPLPIMGEDGIGVTAFAG